MRTKKYETVVSIHVVFSTIATNKIFVFWSRAIT